MKKNITGILAAALIGATLFGGCGFISKDTVIPGEIITKAMNAYKKPTSYYGEAKMQIIDDKNKTDATTIKEWVDYSNGKMKRRSEIDSQTSGKTISTSDGSKLLIYMEKSKKAMSMKVDWNQQGNASDYKEQLMKELNTITKTHELSYKGEETINGFKTYHLYAKPKKSNNLIGEVNYWIDEDNWFVIKNSSENSNFKTNMEYTKLDFSPKLQSSLFTQNLPSDVKIEDLDNSSLKENVIDMKQAEKIAGKHILKLPENSGYTLKKITILNAAAVQHKEIVQTYEKNGAEALTLSTIIFNDGKVPENKDDLKLGDEKDITVRGKKGTSMEDTIKTIFWSEDGFNYDLLIQDPTLSIDDAKKIVETLK